MGTSYFLIDPTKMFSLQFEEKPLLHFCPSFLMSNRDNNNHPSLLVFLLSLISLFFLSFSSCSFSSFLFINTFSLVFCFEVVTFFFFLFFLFSIHLDLCFFFFPNVFIKKNVMNIITKEKKNNIIGIMF